MEDMSECVEDTLELLILKEADLPLKVLMSILLLLWALPYKIVVREKEVIQIMRYELYLTLSYSNIFLKNLLYLIFKLNVYRTLVK